VSLIQRLHHWSQTCPDQIALQRGAQRLTFQAWAALSDRWAADLQRRGLQRGDRVLLMVGLSVELYGILAALWQMGAVVVALHPQAGREALGRACEALQLQAWIAPRPLLWGLPRLVPALGRIPHPIALGDLGRNFVDGGMGFEEPDPDAIALISFTSGSTGEAKLIERSHRQLQAQGQALAPILQSQPGSRELAILPLFGLAHLGAGGRLVLPDWGGRSLPRIPGRRLLQLLQSANIQRLVASPTVFNRLIQAAQGQTLPQVEQIFIGGAPVGLKLLTHLQALAPQAQIATVYGATEAEPIAYQGDREMTRGDRGAIAARPDYSQGLCVGPPISAITLTILSPHSPNPESPEAFAQITVSPGEPGEICVTGPHILTIPHSLHQFTLNGQRWHRTGDLGYQDPQGRLWLLGRVVGLIKDERGLLYPWAVEAVANDWPGVMRSAVVSQRGQRVLYVQWLWGYQPQDYAGLKAQLTWAKLDRIAPMAKIPVERRHGAKIDYPRLFKRLGIL